MEIQKAEKNQAREIARLIMVAMNYECCQFFAGPDHTLQDFEDAMTRLVAREDTQYSYRNTLAAMEGGELAGVLVCYDGGRLYELREAFIAEAKAAFGRDVRGILADETEAGELYLDSLCVRPAFRGRGIATALLRAGIERARELGLPRAGLLVDQGNPSAERLYRRIGFRHAGDSAWGGHPMRHLVFDCED